MSNEWEYQVRIYLDDVFAEVARCRLDDATLRPLTDILRRHDAVLKCQFDAFVDYVSDAERLGKDKYPLYEWTKATIEDPAKEAKYIKAFTLYVAGDEVYAKEKADALEADLRPLVGGEVVTRLSTHDTNPARNPQPPEQYRK